MNKRTLDRLYEGYEHRFVKTPATSKSKPVQLPEDEFTPENVWNFIEQVIVPAVEKEAKEHAVGFMMKLVQESGTIITKTGADRIAEYLKSDIELEERENNG